MTLTLSDFDYPLPEELIAQQPLQNRADSRLLVYDGNIFDSKFKNINDFLPQNSLILFNNTKVFPSRMIGKLKTGGKFEVFLLREIFSETSGTDSTCVWNCVGKPMKKIALGSIIYFEENLCAEILEIRAEETLSTFTARFNMTSENLLNWLDRFGLIPLPPYIKRNADDKAQQREDRTRYQTTFAKIDGSVAAPTAGLHFSQEILQDLANKGHDIDFVTLNVGAGTFAPVKQQEISLHQMHEEFYQISANVCQKILSARSNGKKIVCVGTTTLRSVESFFTYIAPESQQKESGLWQKTKLFIYPKVKSERYNPKICDVLITNFHQPRSTLLMLISSLVSFNKVQEIYHHAVEKKYRFLSYGDACLFNLK